MEEIKTPSEIKPPVNGTGKTILGFLLEGLLIWLTLFVVNEIIISGGRYEKNIYLLVINLILTVFLIIIIGLRRKSKNSIEVLKRGVIYLISNFVLDFLIVNLILQANSLSLFKSWQNYPVYFVLLVVPIIISRMQTVPKIKNIR